MFKPKKEKIQRRWVNENSERIGEVVKKSSFAYGAYEKKYLIARNKFLSIEQVPDGAFTDIFWAVFGNQPSCIAKLKLFSEVAPIRGLRGRERYLSESHFSKKKVKVGQAGPALGGALDKGERVVRISEYAEDRLVVYTDREKEVTLHEKPCVEIHDIRDREIEILDKEDYDEFLSIQHEAKMLLDAYGKVGKDV